MILFQGAQLANDTSMVSPPPRWHHEARSCSTPRCGIGKGRKTKEASHPELVGDEGRAWLIVLAAEVGGRRSGETAELFRCLAKAKAGTSTRSGA